MSTRGGAASRAAADPEATAHLESHLSLVPDELHDGLLHLEEIGDLGLRPRLVVLSACESAAGRLYRGEGLTGFARAFIVAGSEAVVATLWPVGESAAAVLGEFHARLSRGTNRAAALRAAQRALRSRADRAHPFYWAAFELILGNGRTPPAGGGSSTASLTR